MKKSTLEYMQKLRHGDAIDWSLIPSDIQCIELFEDSPPRFYDFDEGEFAIEVDRNGASVVHLEGMDYDSCHCLLNHMDDYEWRPFKRCEEKTHYVVTYSGSKCIAYHVAGGLFLVSYNLLEEPEIKTNKDLRIHRKINL